MERQDKPGAVCDDGDRIDGRLVEARLLKGRIGRGIGTQLCRTAHAETCGQLVANHAIFEYELSRWTRSRAKRAMDVGIVLAFSPILFPVLAAIGLGVLVTSGAPMFFRQERIGRHGMPFAIYKFRTMRPALVHPSSAIALASAGRITRLGAFLRRSKLDELPQMINVLMGEMSLVGPRPKVPEQQPDAFPCRPGVTGAATLAFAREETLLQGIAPADLDEYFTMTVLTAKRKLDVDYLRRATIWSDLWMIAETVLGRWESHSEAAFWLRNEESRLEASGETASLSQ